MIFRFFRNLMGGRHPYRQAVCPDCPFLSVILAERALESAQRRGANAAARQPRARRKGGCQAPEWRAAGAGTPGGGGRGPDGRGGAGPADGAGGGGGRQAGGGGRGGGGPPGRVSGGGGRGGAGGAGRGRGRG